MKYNAFLKCLGFIIAVNGGFLCAMEDLDIISVEYNAEAEHYLPTQKASYKGQNAEYTTVTEKGYPLLFKFLRENEEIKEKIRVVEGRLGGFITVVGDLQKNPTIATWTNRDPSAVEKYIKIQKTSEKHYYVLGIPSIADKNALTLYWERNSILAKINHLMFIGAFVCIILWCRASKTL